MFLLNHNETKADLKVKIGFTIQNVSIKSLFSQPGKNIFCEFTIQNVSIK